MQIDISFFLIDQITQSEFYVFFYYSVVFNFMANFKNLFTVESRVLMHGTNLKINFLPKVHRFKFKDRKSPS